MPNDVNSRKRSIDNDVNSRKGHYLGNMDPARATRVVAEQQKRKYQ